MLYIHIYIYIYIYIYRERERSLCYLEPALLESEPLDLQPLQGTDIPNRKPDVCLYIHFSIYIYIYIYMLPPPPSGNVLLKRADV